MQARIIEREAINARIEIQVPEDEVNKAYSGIYRSLAQQVRVDGFRPGKAPKRVLEAKVGKDSIDAEVREALIEHFYPRAVQDLDLQPVTATVDAGKPVEGEAFTFEVALELYPEVALADPAEIVIDAEVPTLTDTQFEEAVAALRRDRATLLPVDRAVEPGDYLSVESLTESGESSGNSMPLDLENIDERLAEGFIGKSVGDLVELKIPHNHPLEEDEEEDKGEDEHVSVLKVRILDVKAKEKPELGDDFAKTLGFDTWAEAENRIRQNLQDRLDLQGFEEQQEEFIDKLVETSEAELPGGLVERRVATLRARFADDLERRGSTLESYLNSLDEAQRDEFEREVIESARRQVKRDLVLERLLDSRATALSEEEFKAALGVMAESRRMNVAQLRKELGDEGLANYRYLLTRDKAVREALQDNLKGAAASAGADAGANQEASPEASAGNEA